jgi:serine/threonine protein kinase
MNINGLIHLDIKPENILMDERGYLHITDMVIYVAFEVNLRQNNGLAVDYLVLGIVCNELIVGKRPYGGKTHKDIRDSINKSQINLKIRGSQGWTMEAADF